MVLKSFNVICVFLVVVTLLPSIIACSGEQFYNGVDLDSGKIHYPLAGGAFYSESPCFNVNLTGNLVVTNFSIPYEHQIVYYPGSLRVGLIDFLDNTSLFYKYLSDNRSLSKIYSMGSHGTYLSKTDLIYSASKLSRVESYFTNDEMIYSLDFVFGQDTISIVNEDINETFGVYGGKIQNRTQTASYEDETYTFADYFSYSNDSTRVVSYYDNSIVSGFVYDYNLKNFSQSCIDFDEGNKSIFTSALVSYGGDFSYDTCYSTLIEYYCGFNLLRWDFWNALDKVPKSREVFCEYGCSEGKCLEAIQSECVLDSDCSLNQSCIDGSCKHYNIASSCVTNSDCRNLELCVESKCVLDLPEDPNGF